MIEARLNNYNTIYLLKIGEKGTIWESEQLSYFIVTFFSSFFFFVFAKENAWLEKLCMSANDENRMYVVGMLNEDV